MLETCTGNTSFGFVTSRQSVFPDVSVYPDAQLAQVWSVPFVQVMAPLQLSMPVHDLVVTEPIVPADTLFALSTVQTRRP